MSVARVASGAEGHADGGVAARGVCYGEASFRWTRSLPKSAPQGASGERLMSDHVVREVWDYAPEVAGAGVVVDARDCVVAARTGDGRAHGGLSARLRMTVLDCALAFPVRS